MNTISNCVISVIFFKLYIQSLPQAKTFDSQNEFVITNKYKVCKSNYTLLPYDDHKGTLQISTHHLYYLPKDLRSVLLLLSWLGIML